MKKHYITLKDVLIERIFSEIHFLNNDYLQIVNQKRKIIIPKRNYKECVLYNVNNILIFEVPDDSSFIRYEDLIDVTNDPSFELLNILNGSVKNANLIIEGADGTGKSTVTREIALEDKMLCQDRNVNGITRIVSSLTIPFDIKVKNIYNFVESNQEKDILFLILSDIKEMKRRIFNRERLSEWDLRAEKTQEEYINIYNELHFCNNLFLYDISNKTISDVKGIVRKHISKKELK